MAIFSLSQNDPYDCDDDDDGKYLVSFIYLNCLLLQGFCGEAGGRDESVERYIPYNFGNFFLNNITVAS